MLALERGAQARRNLVPSDVKFCFSQKPSRSLHAFKTREKERRFLHNVLTIIELNTSPQAVLSSRLVTDPKPLTLKS